MSTCESNGEERKGTHTHMKPETNEGNRGAQDHDYRRGYDRHDCERSRDQGPQREPSTLAVLTKTVRFKKQEEDQDMEDLLSKLYGLNIRDSALHAWLCCCWPSVADPEPITTESLSPPSLISPTRTRPSFGSLKRWRKEITEGRS
jgi:hypothetical protein